MKFSLILCTLGREKEVTEFLESLLRQKADDYQLIIVDQNKDNRIERCLKEAAFPLEKVLLIKQALPGLSRARNVGLKFAEGDIIAFPDDDCIYDDDVLIRVADFFLKHGQDNTVLSVNTRDVTSDAALVKLPKEACQFDRNFLLGCSFTLFFGQSAKTLRFDERLGVGSGFVWGAGEEHDFLYRFLGKEEKGRYLPQPLVFHPAKEDNTLDIKRAYLYGAGLAAFRMKNFSLTRVFKGAIFICFEIFSNALTGRWRNSLFKLYFLSGYTVGVLTWKLANR